MIAVMNAAEVSVETLLARRDTAADVSGAVSEIIARVRRDGDKALLAYAEQFDRAKLDSLEVTEAIRSRPIPGIPKTCSITMDPEKIPLTIMPISGTTETIAFLSTCT